MPVNTCLMMMMMMMMMMMKKKTSQSAMEMCFYCKRQEAKQFLSCKNKVIILTVFCLMMISFKNSGQRNFDTHPGTS